MPSILAGIRLAVHFGEVAPFIDITERANFVGDGMNDCARLLQEVKPSSTPSPGIPIDESFIVVSSDGFASFSAMYPQCPELQGFLSSVKFAQSDEFEISDKHRKVHRCRFVEFSRQAAISPPKPSDLEDRLKKMGTPRISLLPCRDTA